MSFTNLTVMKMNILIFLIELIILKADICPNNCSGHGYCKFGVCECFGRGKVNEKSYFGSDCSLYKCENGNSFSMITSKFGSKSKSNSRSLISSSLKRNLLVSDKSSSVRRSEVKLKIELPSLGEKEKEKLIYKVSGLFELSKYLPKSGGFIKCTNEEKSKIIKVEIVGINEDKNNGYILLDSSIDPTNNPNLRCNRIISKRKSMIYYGNLFVDGNGILKWRNYGIILKEMGMLRKSERDGNKYEKSDFSFGCFTPPIEESPVNEHLITIYNNVKGEYTENGDNKDLIITFEDPIPTLKSGDICYCIMNGDIESTAVDKTELSDYIKKEDGENVYSFVKYTGLPLDKDKNGNLVVISENNNLIISTENTAKLTNIDISFFIVSRIVYVDMIRNGIIKEKKVKIINDDGDAITIQSNDDNNPFIKNDIILPYIKYHSSNPIQDIKPIISGILSSSLYDVYGLPESLVLQLHKDYGGLLQCKYNNEDIIVDVKRENHVFYDIISTVEFPSTITIDEDEDISSLKCNRILYRRNDYSMFNPSIVYIENSQYKLKWTCGHIFLPYLNKPNFACYSNTDHKITEYKDVGIDIDSLPDYIFIFNNDHHPSENDICFLLGKKADFDFEPIEISESDLYNHIGEEIEGSEIVYYFGKLKLENSEEIKCDENNKNEDLICITKSDNINIKESSIIIKEEDLNENEIKYFKKDEIIYIEIISFNYIPYNYKVRIISYKNQIIHFTPSIPNNSELSNIFIIPNPVKHMRVIKRINPSKYIYKLSDFYDNMIYEFYTNLGGKMKCKYIKRDLKGNEIRSELGIVDVKGYKREEIIEYGYFEFDHEMTENDNISKEKYNFKDIICEEIIMKRNDMSLLNIIKIDDKSNYNREYHELRWSNYVEILINYINDIKSSEVSFSCYNENDSTNKRIKFYNGITVEMLYNDIIFRFNENNEPNENDICYLMINEKCEIINIESSDLYLNIRKEDENEYYFGSIKENDENNKNENLIYINEDGNLIQIIKSELIINEEENESNKEENKNKINIININNENNPSILYPPILINDEMKKYLIVGNILEIRINNVEYSEKCQIINIKYNEKLNKFEILLNKAIVYSKIKSRRIMKNDNDNNNDEKIRPLTNIESISLIFENEGSVHNGIECSGQGICDRSVGICKCFEGYSGSVCERLECPSNCNGNGICVSLSDLLSNEEINNNYNGFGNKHEGKYKDENGNFISIKFENQVYGCLCDKRHRGYDCSLIECPSGVDPEIGSNNGVNEKENENRDCSGRGICDYSSGICKCFSGFSGEACQMMNEMM